jgi:hypothetical protein
VITGQGAFANDLVDMRPELTHGFLQVPSPCDDQIRPLDLFRHMPYDFAGAACPQMNTRAYATVCDLLLEFLRHLSSPLKHYVIARRALGRKGAEHASKHSAISDARISSSEGSAR